MCYSCFSLKNCSSDIKTADNIIIHIQIFLILKIRDFIKKQIAEWEAKSREASEKADLAAFEFAEREIKNYKAMLKQYE